MENVYDRWVLRGEENADDIDGHALTDVSLEDVTKIFAGEITNWSEADGEDLVANDTNAIGYALTGFMVNSVNRY